MRRVGGPPRRLLRALDLPGAALHEDAVHALVAHDGGDSRHGQELAHHGLFPGRGASRVFM